MPLPRNTDEDLHTIARTMRHLPAHLRNAAIQQSENVIDARGRFGSVRPIRISGDDCA